MTKRKHFKIGPNLLTIPKDADNSSSAPLVSRKRHKNRGKIYGFCYRLDLKILRIIKNQKDMGILDVREALDVIHRALKSHIRRLLKIKLIQEQEKQKHGKIPLKITNDGEKVLEIFDRNLRK